MDRDSRLIFVRLETNQPEIRLSPHCIYRTPKLLRKENEAAYTPRLVSIGPYHCENEELRRMEELRCIMDRKEELKSYYAEITLSDKSFVEMILLDGVFIIELFLRMFYPDLVQSSDVILLQSTYLISDLFFMQENQLPWFVIEELYNKDVIQPEPHRIPFLDLALSICSSHVPWHCPDINMIRGLRVKHLHDLLRTTIIHPLPSHAYCLPSAQRRLSATILCVAGVKFKVRKFQSFLNIIFHEGALHMPSFIFDRNTETFARNLMAYEQDYTSHTLLCDYFYLMDSLINTSEDVDLLVKSGIITNRLDDNDEVVTLVNNLFKHVQIGVNQFYYAKVCADLDDHCKKRWNNWKTAFKRDYLKTLKRDYFSTPWKAASTVAAIILLLLTFIQTVCSLVSLYK